MGIVNITHDSFFSGNKFLNDLVDIPNDIFKYSDIIDVGAESTKPFSNPVNSSEEIERITKFNIKKFKKNIFSIDSYKYEVIKYALENGYNMINDITAGGLNNKNLELAKDFNVPIVLMHMQGNPKSMQINPKYDDLISDLMLFFDNKINCCINLGIPLKNIIIDPGIGFGKSIDDNFEIIKRLSEFKKLDVKILIGISRKSFLQVDNDKPEDRLGTSLSAMSIAVNNGADIVRVHDVYSTFKALNIIDRIKNQS
mgnify:CR=1 FL=1